MNESLIFSLRHAEVPVVEESLDFLLESPFKYFEISGSLFESKFYDVLKRKFFESDKRVSGVYDLMPPSLSRNWTNSSSKISAELQALLSERLSCLSQNNIDFAEIDLALDEVAKGKEVDDIESRSRLVSMALRGSLGETKALLLSLRFPKAFPKSFEWRYTVMLQNEIAHRQVGTVVNIFPFECRPEQFCEFMKKTFYSARATRFCFDPVSDGFLNRESLKRWLQVFSDQGYDGSVILSPRIDTVPLLQDSFTRLAHLLKAFDV